MSRKTDLENMWFAVLVNGATKRIQGKKLSTDLPDDALMFAWINGGTKKISLFDMRSLSDGGDYSGRWWVATQDVSGVHTTYRVNGTDMKLLFPAPEMISLVLTPNPVSVEVGEQVTVTASTTGIEAGYYTWDNIDSGYLSVVEESQDGYIILKGKAESSRTDVLAMGYNFDASDNPVSATLSVTVTVPDYTNPKPPQTPDNPISCAWTSHFTRGWGISDGYQYILAPGGDGNKNFIGVLDNVAGTMTQYVPKNIQGTQLGGGFYWENMFYIIQGKWTDSPSMYKRHKDNSASWDEGWSLAGTVRGGVAGHFGYSKWGVSSGKYGTTGSYYVMKPGQNTFSTLTFSGALAGKRIWCVHSSDNQTTIVTDSEGSVYKMDDLISPSTARKVYSWPGGLYEDTGGCDIATDNKGTWMIAKRKQYGNGPGGGIMISLDDGTSWTSKDPPGTGGKYRHVSGVAYGDGVWMCTMTELPWNNGTTRVAKSTNNGSSWSVVSSSDQQQGQPQTGCWSITYAGNRHWCVDFHTRETCFF